MAISALTMQHAHTESGIIYARYKQTINKIYEVLRNERDNPFEGITSVRVRLEPALMHSTEDQANKVLSCVSQELIHEGYSVEFEYESKNPFSSADSTISATHIVVSWDRPQ